MLVEDVKFSLKAVADYLLTTINGKQSLPYQPKPTIFNLYAGHLTKTVNAQLQDEVWVGQLFFASKDEGDFTEIIHEIENFLKTRGKTTNSILHGRDVTLEPLIREAMRRKRND
jgi:hypothetical protein